MMDPVIALVLLTLFAFGFAGTQAKPALAPPPPKKKKRPPHRHRKPTGIPPSLQPPLPGKTIPATIVVKHPPPKGPVPEKVPRTYIPKGGWKPYISRWSVSRAKEVMHSRLVMPGSSLTEIEPSTGYTVKFRGETGKEIGNPRLLRAVTAWRKI